MAARSPVLCWITPSPTSTTVPVSLVAGDSGQRLAGHAVRDVAVSTSSDYVRVMDQRLCQWLLCQANSYPVR
jgi:hypothetical protein